MDNITKVRYYGCDFGRHIAKYFPRWEKDKENYNWLQKHFKEKKLKNDNEKGVKEKVLNLRSRYKLTRCFTKEAIPEAIDYMHQNKKMLYRKMKCGNKKIVGEIALNMGHKSKRLKRQMATGEPPKGRKSKRFNRQMCFATKLCFFHNETTYPICDSNAWAALEYHKKKLEKTHPTEYTDFKEKLEKANNEWHDPSKPLNYSSYKNVIDYFIDLYELRDLICKGSRSCEAPGKSSPAQKKKRRACYRTLDWCLCAWNRLLNLFGRRKAYYKTLDWYLWVFGDIVVKAKKDEIKYTSLLKDMALEVKTPNKR